MPLRTEHNCKAKTVVTFIFGVTNKEEVTLRVLNAIDEVGGIADESLSHIESLLGFLNGDEKFVGIGLTFPAVPRERAVWVRRDE